MAEDLANVVDFLAFKKGTLERSITDSLRDGQIDIRAVRDLKRIQPENETALVGESAKAFVARDYEACNDVAMYILQRNEDNLPALKLYLTSGLFLLQRKQIDEKEYLHLLLHYRQAFPDQPDVLKEALDYFESQSYSVEIPAGVKDAVNFK